MNSENCPSQMVFILLLLLSTDPIVFKEVKNSTGWGFLCVPFSAIAIAITRILFNYK